MEKIYLLVESDFKSAVTLSIYATEKAAHKGMMMLLSKFRKQGTCSYRVINNREVEINYNSHRSGRLTVCEDTLWTEEGLDSL